MQRASWFLLMNAHSRSLLQPVSTHTPFLHSWSSGQFSSWRQAAIHTPDEHLDPIPALAASLSHWRHLPSTQNGVCVEVHSALLLQPGAAATHSSSMQSCPHWHRLRKVLQKIGSIAQFISYVGQLTFGTK